MDMDWRGELDAWPAPFVAALRHKRRSVTCPAYIAGLIGPGDRKSIQPMTARSDAIAYDRLHHFIGASLWDSAPLEAILWRSDVHPPLPATATLSVTLRQASYKEIFI